MQRFILAGFSQSSLTSRHNKDANFRFAFLILHHCLPPFNHSYLHLFLISPEYRSMARTAQSHRRAGSSKPPATIPAASPASNSKLPPQVRFPLLVVLSLTISSLLYSLVSPFTSGDLATVSRSRDNWWEIAALLGWKGTQLAIGWYGGFDSTNLAFSDGDTNLILVL